jgi:hypothetical protein
MRKRLSVFLLAIALTSISWALASAQNGIIDEQHYLVYDLPDPITFVEPIILNDQFGEVEALDFVLRQFANPVEKLSPDGTVLGPILDFLAHQTWWEFQDPHPEHRFVDIDNQFGRERLVVTNRRFLVLPAGKDNPDIPWRNHYQCYDADGPPVGLQLVLADQFGLFDVVVLHPALFCNPVEKIRATGAYPIVNPEAHMTCYDLDPIYPVLTGHNAFDQFGSWNIRPTNTRWLCVPTDKLTVIGTEDSSWGRIKSLYKN